MTKKKYRKKELLISDNHSFESEKVRSVQVNMQYSTLPLKGRKIIMFTSVNKGDGKTFCIANIGREFADQGNKVLLIDLDLHRPQLSRDVTIRRRIKPILGSKGLMGAMRNPSQWQSQVVPLESENLYLLPIEVPPPNPIQILRSEQLKNIIYSAASEFDLILIDTPPIGVFTDAKVIAGFCAGIVLVVKSGTTNTITLREVKEDLEKTTTPIIGAVLNQKEYVKRNRDNNYAYY